MTDLFSVYKNSRCSLFLTLFFCLQMMVYSQQKVALVLSGGGAAGIAHAGVIKALEEHDIPIDYIAGTSMGSLVGGMYASGYSADQIFHILTSKDYTDMARGVFLDKHSYFFKKEDPTASWLSFKISPTGKVSSLIPTSFISSMALDFKSLELFSRAEAAARYNFDSLFVPFRCVAADVYNKEPLVFQQGYLTKSIRASATYPLYIDPIRVDGKLLFDGGLYNNFPTDVVYKDFFPDIIIGSKSATSLQEPMEGDFVSQFRAMIVKGTDYNLPCENDILIEPNLEDIGTFDFLKAKQAFQRGYEQTVSQMPDILKAVQSRKTTKQKNLERRAFQATFKPLVFDQVEINGVNKAQKKYIKKSLFASNDTIDIEFLKKRYFRIFSDDKIKSIYPSTRFDTLTSNYKLELEVEKEKDFEINVGGNFASRPVSTGFMSLKYNYLSYVALGLKADYYFGRFYNSLLFKARLDVPLNFPFYVEPELHFNNYDYFNTQNGFFVEDRPSYLQTNEEYYGVNVGVPVSKKGKTSVGIYKGEQKDQYYQRRDFLKSDTTDITKYTFISPYISFERSTQNEKSYPEKGTYTLLSGRFVFGDETHLPGSTAPSTQIYKSKQDWFQARFYYDNYYKSLGKLRLGFNTEVFYSTQKLFNNYTASIAKAYAYRPTVESRYLFLETFRANQFASLGHKFIYRLTKNIQLRAEGYIFQPFERIIRDDQNIVSASELFDKRYIVGSAGLVLKTPLGPLSFSTNYYHNVPELADENKTPLTFFFHFGHAIFNKRAFE